jgi:hypothetical protein
VQLTLMRMEDALRLSRINGGNGRLLTIVLGRSIVIIC